MAYAAALSHKNFFYPLSMGTPIIMPRKKEERTKAQELILSVRMWLRNFMIPVSLIFSILFLVVTIIGTMGTFFSPDGEPYESIGNWDTWMFAGGLLGLGIAGWYLYDTWTSKQKFEELVSTTNRRMFLKHLDELDFLVRKLPDSDYERYKKARKKLKIKG